MHCHSYVTVDVRCVHSLKVCDFGKRNINKLKILDAVNIGCL